MVKIFTIMAFCFLGGVVKSQHLNLGIPEKKIQVNDSTWVVHGKCKSNYLFHILKPGDNGPVNYSSNIQSSVSRTPFLKISGNIQYDFSYWSHLDTPFAEKNVSQHITQTHFDVNFLGKYPGRIILRNRSTNSPFFRDFTDFSFQFDRNRFLKILRDELTSKLPGSFTNPRLSKSLSEINTIKKEVSDLQDWINSPQRAQELANQRLLETSEPKIKTGIKPFSEIEPFDFTTASLNKLGLSFANKRWKKVKDSKSSGENQKPNFLEEYELKKEKLTALRDSLKLKEKEYSQLTKSLQDSMGRVKADLKNVKDRKTFSGITKDDLIKRNDLSRTQRLLLSVKKLGFGRTFVNYSELTVKNTTLTGLDVEINPLPFYFAFAAGKVNYGFRDFLSNNKSLPNQSLYLFRVGLGNKETNNLILTFYNGNKSVLQSGAAGAPFHIQKVLGVSVEGRLQINDNLHFIGEVAKSSFNPNASPLPVSDLIDKAFDMRISDNQAYSVKAVGKNPATGTRFWGSYRRMGKYFQSFNLSPANLSQDAWNFRVNQDVFKRKVIIDASIRKNDFLSSFNAIPVRTETIFKSIQATARFPKYPFVSVGYYPSSQLTLVDNSILVESQFNTLNITSGYNYSYKNLRMSSSFVFSKFYNKAEDSAFLYFDSHNATLTHSIFLSRMSLLFSFGQTVQDRFKVLTAEGGLTFRIKEVLSLSASGKTHHFNSKSLLGGNLGVAWGMRNIGSININYQKLYLPANSDLVPIDVGRLTFIREF